MTKVCHFTSSHNSDDTRVFYKECVSLAEAGYQVFLVAQGESREEKGVHIIGIGEKEKSRFHRMTEITKMVYEKALELDADIYHFHEPELLPYGMKLKKRGKKVIFDSHENTALAIAEKGYIPKPIRSVVQNIYTSYEKKICSRLDAVITVTPTQTFYFKTINSETTQVTNYPELPSHFSEPQFNTRDLVFAGGILEQWCHTVIIEAISRIPECNYILCGGDNAYRKSLENIAGWEKVKYLGSVPHVKVSEILSKATIGMALLRPGMNTAWKTGTIGNTKIFEEMIAGLPIICTNFDLWREFVEKYKCGICVNPEDVNEVKKAINMLLNDKKLCRTMGKNGQRAIREQFNWNVEKRNLIGLYERINNEY